jgi:hypothetical protein
LLTETFSAAGVIILKITYGYDVLPENDPFVMHAEREMKELTKMVTPGAYLVDMIPARTSLLPRS